MSNDNTKKVSVFSILIFILCALLAVYTVASIISVTSYIKEMFAYGQITMGQNFYDIISYYVTNCGVYVIYICILLSIWWISDKKKVARKAETTISTPSKDEPTKSELDAKKAKKDKDADKSKEDKKDKEKK